MAPSNHSHEDFARTEHVQASSDRSFGYVFAGFFTIVGAVSLWRSGAWWPYAFPLAAAMGVMALARPSVLAPLNRAWTRFGLLLSKIMNPLILGLVFYTTVVPTGLIMRALGKDLLRLKLDKSAPTYWIAREPPGPPPESMRNQY